MSLSTLGTNISQIKVEHISVHGIWLFVEGKEYFLPYSDYPWFKNACISEIMNLEFNNGYHLHWPELDIDIDLNDVENPQNAPLTYKEKGSIQ